MSATGIALDAATAAGFGDRPPPKRMRLTSFKPVGRGALNGKKQYEQFLAWPDRATSDRWSAALVELVRDRYPEAFDDEAVA